MPKISEKELAIGLITRVQDEGAGGYAVEQFSVDEYECDFENQKLKDPNLDVHKEGKYFMLSVQELVSADQCDGRFVFGRESKKVRETTNENSNNSYLTMDGTNLKSLLQNLLMRAGHSAPKYKTKHLKTNVFRALVEFKGMQFVGKPKKNKQLAERDAAIEALTWLTHNSDNYRDEDDNSPPDVTDNMLKLLGKQRRSKRHS